MNESIRTLEESIKLAKDFTTMLENVDESTLAIKNLTMVLLLADRVSSVILLSGIQETLEKCKLSNSVQIAVDSVQDIDKMLKPMKIALESVNFVKKVVK